MLAKKSDFSKELSGIGEKIDALSIILTAPLWPKLEDLPETAHALYNSLIENAKPYALALSQMRYEDAQVILSEWGYMVNQFIDDSHIAGCEASQKLLAVFKHYADAMADFSKIS